MQFSKTSVIAASALLMFSYIGIASAAERIIIACNRDPSPYSYIVAACLWLIFASLVRQR